MTLTPLGGHAIPRPNDSHGGWRRPAQARSGRGTWGETRPPERPNMLPEPRVLKVIACGTTAPVSVPAGPGVDIRLSGTIGDERTVRVAATPLASVALGTVPPVHRRRGRMVAPRRRQGPRDTRPALQVRRSLRHRPVRHLLTSPPDGPATLTTPAGSL